MRKIARIALSALGAYDARWKKSLTTLKALRSKASGPTYIRFAHEMNCNWYPWSVNSTHYKSFMTAWKRYRAIQKKVYPKATLVFSVNRESIGAGMDWRKFFPGKKFVDAVSVDFYNNDPYVSTAAQRKASLGQKDSYGAPKGLATYVAFSKRMGLPLGISEWSGNADFGDSPVLVSSLLGYVKAHAGAGAGRIRYEILFNVRGYNNKFALYGPGVAMPASSRNYRSLFTLK